ncbi:DNA polymerase III PolC-type [Clostridium tepidiprofundi DSM 19306]|uniref:DNA polymerase III PolC-type n=1 Tax=Clostridium tepidiprofundi DSM 19306 TaxID=1121338 RepID=A0A151B334_9CLOT|nr:PHP domain-containing protein [Clostridium tepidiprofundi]KYH34328.1 DNA polymerase III PolC-type [Clostridium tepidiprofundi DSM 19306]
MKIYVDLHIHTALSPCGDNDMTPNNIVNMAFLKGLDAIAITDHNSSENVKACIDVGKRVGITVIPGMELQTKEDIHVICLFKNIDFAMTFQDYVYNNLTTDKNNEEIFGKQIIYDEEDNIIGYNDKLLLASSNISFDEAFYKVKELDGVFIPAHVDRDSFSVISNLGFIPDYLDIKTIEYNSLEKLKKFIEVGIINKNYKFIKSSDAHNLGRILERKNGISAKNIAINAIFNALN